MKFIDNIAYYTISKSAVLSVEVDELKITETTQIGYNAVLITSKKNNAEIADYISFATNIELKDWVEKYNKNIPVLLTINSSMILHKTLTIQNKTDVDEIIRENFAAISPSDFSGQIFSFGNTKIASIVRKSYINSILQHLEFLQKNIIYVTIGPFHILRYCNQIFPFEKSGNLSFNFQNYSFRIDDNELIEYKIHPYITEHKKKEQVITLNNRQDIPSSLLLAYSYGLNYLVSPFTLTNLEIAKIKSYREEYFFQKHVKILGTVLISILFLLLIISSILFTVYNNKYISLQERYVQFKHSSQLSDERKTAINKRERLLLENGFLQKQRISHITDELINTVPSNMYVRKIEVYPEKKKAFKGEALFESSSIIVNGNCYSTDDLQKWINILKSIWWINDVTVKEYKQSDNNELYEFVIYIDKNSI